LHKNAEERYLFPVQQILHYRPIGYTASICSSDT